MSEQNGRGRGRPGQGPGIRGGRGKLPARGERGGSGGRGRDDRGRDERGSSSRGSTGGGRGRDDRGRDERGSSSRSGTGGGRGRIGRPGDRRDDRRDGRQGGRPGDRDRRDRRDDRTDAQRVYDGPPIPDDVSAKDLDRYAMQSLQSLPEKLRERVARHLVMAGVLVGTDPETAYQHVLAARSRAPRNGLIREASGEVAYAAGKFAEALSEFRAARRMNGQKLYAPMMADCERALGRPAKALEYDTADMRAALDDAGQVELTIVVAGARSDLGQNEAALLLLETENLHSGSHQPWVPRLRYAYADTLLAAGRREEAVEWFHRTVAVDPEQMTDAVERLRELDPSTDED